MTWAEVPQTLGHCHIDPQSIARTVHRASNSMIEALEGGGGFAVLCFGEKLRLGKPGQRAFWPFIGGDITPENMVEMAESLVFEASARLHFLKRERPLNEKEQRLAKEIHELILSLRLFLDQEASA
jgi:hypothetical protein